MITSVFQAIIDKLANDSTLTSYIGPGRVYRARMTAPAQIPAVTVMENNEKSIPRVGYIAGPKTRDNSPTVQIDVWVSSADESFPCTGEDADMIAERIDQLLLDASSPVTDTRAGTWQKTSSSQQHDEDTRIWHNALRYTFEYSLTDT